MSMKGISLEKRLFFITGSPGIGKTTILLQVIEALKTGGYNVGGMISREVRAGGARVGFEILDLSNGRKGWLAHTNQKDGPWIGKYRVNLKDLNNIGSNAIVNAVEKADILAVDEVGPMELYSEDFKEAVRRATESGKPMIGTVHWKARDKLIDEIRTREDAETYQVTYENRGNLPEEIVGKVLEFLAKTAK